MEERTDKEPAPKDDIWAFGCLAYELATGKAPFTQQDGMSILKAVKES